MASVFSCVRRRTKGRVIDDAGSPLTASNKFTDEVGPLDFPHNCEGPADGCDLVFVHGLRGSRLKTWSRDGVFWPHDLLKDDLEARVITWGYDTSIANLSRFVSKESLVGHASTLLNDLARLRRKTARPIIFICHSLGGLVVKEALITSASYKAHGRSINLGEIYASTIGVIFMGTPHRGSDKESYGDIAAKIAKLCLRQPNRQLLQTLAADSHILEKQRNDFTTISNNMAIVCIREEVPTAIGIIVPEASASYDGFNVTRNAINANHMDMVRFATRGEGYKRTVSHIQDILDTITPSMKQEKDSIEDRKNEILNNILNTGVIRAREVEIEEASGHTCSWVWDEQVTSNKTPVRQSGLISWLQNTEPLLWISGKAGCGKSTLMKNIYRNPKTKLKLEQASKADGKDLILVGHFFSDRGHNDQKSREGMLRSILYQVLGKRRDLIPMVFPQWFPSDGSSQVPELKPNVLGEFFKWNNLTGAFYSMSGHLRDSRICLFLDGLDEYRMAGREKDYKEEDLDLIYDGNNEDEAWGRSTWITDGHKEIAKFLQKFAISGDTKICVSSRELVVFEQEFRNAQRIVVHVHTAGAIAEYCESRLTNEAPNLVDLSNFVSDITANSRGVFLWVKLVIDMVVDGYTQGDYPDELWKNIEKLPSRLGGKDGLYMLMMKNIRREHLEESKRLFQLLILWPNTKIHDPPDIITFFLAAQGHLQDESPQDLRVSSDKYELKTWDEWEGRWKSLHRRLKSRCAGLLEGTKRVQFMHQTAKQFILREYLWPSIFQNAVGFATQDDVSLAIASGLIRRLKCCANGVSAGDQHYGVSKEEAPTTVSQILLRIFVMAGVASATTTPKQESRLHYFYTRLLDELDNIGNRITRDSGTSPVGMEVSWLNIYVRIEPEHDRTMWLVPGRRKIGSLLELATQLRIGFYVKAKVRNGKLSRDQLSRLLLWATPPSIIEFRGQDLRKPRAPRLVRLLLQEGADLNSRDLGSIIEFRKRHLRIPRVPRLVQLLLQEGADPNSRDLGQGPNMTAEEDLTPWTTYLRDILLEVVSGWEMGNEIETDKELAKIFLEHGADPEARWCMPNSSKIITAETALNEVFGDTPYLDEILKLLHQAKEKMAAE